MQAINMQNLTQQLHFRIEGLHPEYAEVHQSKPADSKAVSLPP